MILENLRQNDLMGLFFITGHMAEKLQDYPFTVKMLSEHQIGYHSSSHSVHPTIFEFTDLKDYDKAIEVSLERETSHINPLTGEIEGRGGINALRTLFPKTKIVAFRAPGHCWSPPHLEALHSLGITFDFSTNISRNVVCFKGITFYPYPIYSDWPGTFTEYRLLINSLRQRNIVLTIHPSLMVNKTEWDAIYFESNPKRLIEPVARPEDETARLFSKFNLLLKQLKSLQRTGILNITPSLTYAQKTLIPEKSLALKCYMHCLRWVKLPGYKPKFLLQHFQKFFET